MPIPARILVNPLRLAAGLGSDQMAAVAIGLALAAEHPDVTVSVVGLAGDVASYQALDRELTKEGIDRRDLETADVVERVAALEHASRTDAAAELVAGVGPTDLADGGTDSVVVALAARAAFVRLYEAGLLQLADHVVDRCPRCATVVDPSDVEEVELEGELLAVEIPLVDGGVVAVRMHAIELLPGAVAIALPMNDDRVGREAIVPLSGTVVPLLPSTVTAPQPVVPWHDAADQELAWAAGLTGVPVMDGDGVVVVEGPLVGVSRFAARAAARRLLDAEGALSSAEAAHERAGRCRWCGTIVVPIRMHAWFLDIAQLEIDAADAVRNGSVVIDPAGSGDRLLDAAGRHPLWSVTTELPAAPLAPISTCEECAQPAVGLDPSSSCRKCMGPVSGGTLALSSRFIAAMWAVVQAGAADAERETWAVSTAGELAPWCLRAIALGLFLTGRPIFERVVVASAGDE